MDNCQSQIPPLHGSRFCFQEQFRYYYAYGNTPAQDFLEYASSDLKNEEPSVLVLGCGDIRSCFHTIWKNFDPGFKHRFRGVHFVINDRSAAVLARNIIFLYLCLKTPKSKREREKWLFALWSIWFCHELLQEHTGVLKGALEVLLKFSVSNHQWCKPDNPLHSLVHCFSPATFKEIRDTWSMWYNREAKVGSVESMKAARLAEVENCLRNIKLESRRGVLDLCGSVGIDMYRDKYETMCNEYQSYLESGSVYSESLDIRPQLMAKETSVNLTLYERIDGKYTVHYGSCPFRCFQHTYVCSVKEMLNTGMHVAASVNDCVLLDSEAFERTPLLANSFQQFSISVICTANVLQNQQANISFTFNCLDVFEFCHSWEVECNKKQFDLIFATNVIDSVAPPAFIIAAIRLLKDNGYFLSPTMLFRSIAPTAEKYLEAVFGFHPKLLPVLCGIRCINHEDVAYASSVSHNHSPLDSSNVNITFSCMSEKILIWERVKMDPLCVESMSLHLDITLALCGSFLTSCTPLLTNPDGIAVLNCLCTNTSIELLKTFSSRLITGLSKLHKHLEQLCSTMREQKLLKKFLASIQIQAMLNGLHLHIMVNESTCPICADLPLSNYLGLFCVQVEMTHISPYSPMFMVLLHKEPFLSSIPALLEVSQIFDCLSGVTQGSTLKLYFHAPLTFVKDGYKLTVIQYTVCTTPEKCFNFPSIVLQGELCSKYRVDLSSIPSSHRPLILAEYSSSLGTLIKHCGNGDSFESALSFAEDELPALLSADLRVEQISRAEVKIQCLDRCLQIRYPYPVDYDELIVQRHKKSKTLIVKAKRKAHCYDDKGQLFHVNPEDHFSLPPIMVSSDKLQQLLFFQFTLKERKSLLVPRSKSVASPLLTVKKWIMLLLTETDEFFFQLVLPDQSIVGYVEVINRVIDVKRKVPAIDLRFCFLDTLPQTTASFIDGELLRLSFRKSFELTQILLKKELYYNLLKRVFHSFSLHTLQSAGEHFLSSRFSPVKESRIETYFRRAVVYPLYPDPDVAVHDLSRGKRCSYCNNLFELQDLMKCSTCMSASYCSKQCQRNHWSDHKLQCKSTKSKDKASGSFQGSYSHNPQLSAMAQQEQSPESTAEDKKSPAFSEQDMLGQNRYEELPDAHKQAKASETSGQSSLSSCEVRCSYCKLHIGIQDLKKCMGCKSTSYCSKQCQRNHWSEHKLQCKSTKREDKSPGNIQGSSSPKFEPPVAIQQEQPLLSTEIIEEDSRSESPASGKQDMQDLSSCELNNDVRCSYCKLHIEIQDLKKCMGCKSTSYCSKQCQRNHWSEHKLQCKRTQSKDKAPGSIQGSYTHNPQLSAMVQQEQSLESTAEDKKSPAFSEQDMLGQNRYEEFPNAHKQAKASETSGQSSLSSCEVRCSYCKLHIEIQNLKKCMGCKSTSYCSKQCQRNHWSEHKLQCKSTKREDKSPGNIQGSSSPNFEPPVAIQREQPPLSTEIKSPGNIQGSSSPNFEPPVAIQREQPPLSTEVKSPGNIQGSSSPNFEPPVAIQQEQPPLSTENTEEDSRSKSPASGKQDMQNLSSCELNNDVRCTNCKLHIEIQNLMKCSTCMSASYCSKKCQRNHWSEHKLQCKSTKREDKSPRNTQGSFACNTQPSLQQKQSPRPTVKEDSELKPSSSDKQETRGQISEKEFPAAPKEAKPSQPSGSHLKTLRNERCGYCQKRTPSLKSCLGCHKVSYCGRDCQRAHWKQHKDYCKPLK